MALKRISLNLIAYFQDHRQSSRICIEHDIQTIADLEKYIVKVFNIERGFYLLCKNCYLPSTQNIQLLDDNDLIYVMPNYQPESHVEECNVKSIKPKMKHKSTANNEELNVEKSPKAKKLKSTNKYDLKVDANKNNKVETGKPNKVQKPKSKKNDEIKNNEMELINKTDKPNKSNEITNIEINTKEQTKICDTSEVKIRKRRRCITPIKQIGRVTASEIFAVEKRFKTLIGEIDENSSEKKLENDKVDHIPKIVQSVEVVDKEKKLLYEEQLNESLENRKSYSLNEVIDFSASKPQINSLNRIKAYKQQKENSGIGNFLKLISADNSITEDSDDTVQSEKDFVTKRRRVRSRRRKIETNTSANENSDSSVFKSPKIFKPPKSIAAPKSHIKFTNGESENDSETSLVHSTPLVKIIKIENVNENSSLNLSGDKLSFSDTHDYNYVELTDIPSVDSIIMFKKLVIGDNYTPKVSNYILGKVTNVAENEKISVHVLGEFKERHFKTTDGHDELKEPTGRFSCILEEEEQTVDNFEQPLIIDRSALIEPKLLKDYTV